MKRVFGPAMNSLQGSDLRPVQGCPRSPGTRYRQGPEQGLFWIADELTGGRRLLDMAELEISRVRSALTTPDFPGTEPAAA